MNLQENLAMKNGFVLAGLSSALTVVAALAASTAVAEGLPVTINTTACGTYTNIAFDKNGHLILTGDLSCLASSVPTNPPVTTPPVTTPPVTTPPVDSGSAACGVLPAGVVARNDHPWNQEIGSNVRTPITLKKDEVYSLKINKPVGAIKGYGTISTISTTSAAGMRTVVISECPGSMTPAPSTSPFGGNPCEVVGMEDQLTWTFDQKVPRGATQCRLDPAKQYYVNIKHQSADKKASCTSAACYFSYEYKMNGIID